MRHIQNQDCQKCCIAVSTSGNNRHRDHPQRDEDMGYLPQFPGQNIGKQSQTKACQNRVQPPIGFTKIGAADDHSIANQRACDHKACINDQLYFEKRFIQ
jgi:hypothetical protein